MRDGAIMRFQVRKCQVRRWSLLAARWSLAVSVTLSETLLALASVVWLGDAYLISRLVGACLPDLRAGPP